jgi:hypothetical protein
MEFFATARISIVVLNLGNKISSERTKKLSKRRCLSFNKSFSDGTIEEKYMVKSCLNCTVETIFCTTII